MRRWTILAAAAALMAAPAMAQDLTRSSMQGVKIGVADMQKTTAFYTALGMTQGTRYNDHETALEWSGPAQGSRLIMVRDDKGTLAKGGTFLMIAVPDMKVALDRLKAAGFSGLGEPKVAPRSLILMLRDPDGNQIELLSRDPNATPPF